MHTPLDKNFLYLSKKDENRALKLIPLVQFGPSPETPKMRVTFTVRLKREI